MELGLKIGERGTLGKFSLTYDLDYLDSMGLHLYNFADHDLMIVNTKTGPNQTKMSEDYVLTYCGNKIWDIRKEK